MKAHFVTFLSQGTFVCEETTKPIKSWDVQQAKEMAKSITERHGAKPFAFVFSTRSRTDAELDSKVTERSGRYFLGGRVLTLDDVKREMPDQEILIRNMERNDIAKVVVNDNPWRSIQELRPGDVVLDV